MRKEEVRAIHLQTQKVSSENTSLCSNIFGNAFYCTELQHGQQTVCEIQFEILLLFLLLKKTFLSLYQTPHYSLFPTGHQFQLQ